MTGREGKRHSCIFLRFLPFSVAPSFILFAALRFSVSLLLLRSKLSCFLILRLYFHVTAWSLREEKRERRVNVLSEAWRLFKKRMCKRLTWLPFFRFCSCEFLACWICSSSSALSTREGGASQPAGHVIAPFLVRPRLLRLSPQTPVLRTGVLGGLRVSSVRTCVFPHMPHSDGFELLAAMLHSARSFFPHNQKKRS